MTGRPSPSLGKSVPRKEGRAKVTGAALYVDDLRLEGHRRILFGATVRSAVPRGRIRKIHFEGPIPWKEFTIVTAKDVPGKNVVALIEYDQPILAGDVVNHAEEPIVLLAHPDRYLVEEARRHVRVEIDPLPAALTIEEAEAASPVIWGKDNVFKQFLVEKGDVESAWASAHAVVEGEYRTGAQEQLYIETNGVIAVASPKQGVTVWGSMQCPYYVHKALMPIFGLPPEKVRIIQTETGGGFGGKEEYPNMIAGHAALLAWKSGRPVKIIYDRAEDMAATTKRHPSRTRIRSAVTREGKLLALDIDFVIDGGAYMTLSPVVLSRGTIHAGGPYATPNVRIRSRAVATNTPPHGAFRGFGAPQSIFALERHLDQVARRLGLPPEEIRRRNFLSKGATTATHQHIREEIDLEGIMERALLELGYYEKRKRYEAEARANPSARVKRGVGFATFMHGAGFTGSGEKMLASVAGVEATRDGRVRVLSANTEIGQGTNTVFSQIVSDALHLPYEQVEVAQPDTKNVPNSGPTVASRTVMIVGKLIEQAAGQLREILYAAGFLEEGYTPDEFARACRLYVDEHGELKAYSSYKQPKEITWDDKVYRGDAYATYAWACYAADLSVDTYTGEVEIADFVAVQEVGKVVHPILAAGQIEGGVAQALGWGLCENVVWKDGRMANNRMTNYIMMTSADVPPIRVFFEESPSSYGPGGAKGIGELPMDGGAPALLNAIEHATGAALNECPAPPEAVLAALEWVGGRSG